jgi:hypothetical protein
VLSCRRSSPYLWEADPLYRAIQTFDPAAFAQMRRTVQAMGRGGGAREDDVDEALAPLVRKVKRHALRDAPDEMVVAYVRSEVEVAGLLATGQPEACIEVLEGGRLSVDGPDGGTELQLSHSLRARIKHMDSKLIASALLPGRRSPAFTAEQAYAFSGRHIKDEDGDGAMDPRASAEKRCQGDLRRLRRLVAVSDPELARALRFARVRND